MTTYVMRDGRLVDKRTGEPMQLTGKLPDGVPYIASDIQPYKSMIDGRMVTSRSQHRIHLRDHNCIEVGNEKIEAPKPPKRMDSNERKRLLHQAFENVTDKQARSRKEYTVPIPDRLMAQIRGK